MESAAHIDRNTQINARPDQIIPPGAAIYVSVTAGVSNGTPVIHVHGPGGPQTSGTAKKGATEVVLPSTTILNVSPGTWHVAWDSIGYRLMPTLESIQETDDLTLIGSVTVPPLGEATPKPRPLRSTFAEYAASGMDNASVAPLMQMIEAEARKARQRAELELRNLCTSYATAA
jgi:hypothetical protein